MALTMLDQPLPIDPHLPRIVRLVRRHRALVVVAPPGAGKTTRVPPALAVDGPLILLQPRRIAARCLARRIAVEQGWTVGHEVGWQVRFERCFREDTRVLVATEGILTGRLQGDPLLVGFRTVILDEFHERTLHADLGLALARQAGLARDDLRIVVMSATLAAAAVAAFLGDCPVYELGERPHPIDVEYAPRATPSAAVLEALARERGHVLCFLPGAPEIRRLARELGRGRLPGPPTDIRPLHGRLTADEQDTALAPAARRKLVLATNIAETSLTVADVTDVIDTGLHKVLRHDPALGLDRLETERISADSADQRAGRAGRTAAGRAVRLWDPREQLRPRREPEIELVDLAAPLLEVLAWGGDPATFEWFEPPPSERIAAALDLLQRLGAVRGRSITQLGQRLRRVSLHPRLARVLSDAGGSNAAAAACAVLAEGWRPAEPLESSDSDALALADRIRLAPARVRRAAQELQREARRLTSPARSRATVGIGREAEARLRRALLAGYPDRVARRRRAGSARLLLASGHGAVLSADSGVRQAEFLVALDVAAGARGPASEAIVRLASRIELDWLEPTHVTVEQHFDERTEAVRAVERRWYGSLVLAERGVAPDPQLAAGILAGVLAARPPGKADAALLRRLTFAGIEIDVTGLLQRACAGRTVLPTVDLRAQLPFDVGRDLERLAPETIQLPSGRRARLDYGEDGSVAASVRLQELFGLAETPRIGTGRTPLTLSLLAPNGRPVQTTQDLRNFWERTYPGLRRQLRGRYPKHAWPEDPWTAVPGGGPARGRGP